MKKTSTSIEMTLTAGRPAVNPTPEQQMRDWISDREQEVAEMQRAGQQLTEENARLMARIENMKKRHAQQQRESALMRLRAERDAEEKRRWAWRAIGRNEELKRTRGRDIACAVNRVHLRYMRDLAEIEEAIVFAYASAWSVEWGFRRGQESEGEPPPFALDWLFQAITAAGNAGPLRHRTEYARHRASAARRLERAGAMRREGWGARFVSVMILMARVHRLMAEHWALYVESGGSPDALEGHEIPDRGFGAGGWDRRRSEVSGPGLKLRMFELEVEYEWLLRWVESFVSGGRMGEWRWWGCGGRGAVTRPRESAAHREVMGGSEALEKFGENCGGYPEERGQLDVGGYTGPIPADTTGEGVGS